MKLLKLIMLACLLLGCVNVLADKPDSEACPCNTFLFESIDLAACLHQVTIRSYNHKPDQVLRGKKLLWSGGTHTGEFVYGGADIYLDEFEYGCEAWFANAESDEIHFSGLTKDEFMSCKMSLVEANFQLLHLPECN